ncbi:MAG: hypothetical protein AVDCRST_MAG55-1786, partial [uncultured Rubrobacteraceae bacterium]
WSRGDSNPRPPPCKGGSQSSSTFTSVPKNASLNQVSWMRVRRCSPAFAPVTLTQPSRGTVGDL